MLVKCGQKLAKFDALAECGQIGGNFGQSSATFGQTDDGRSDRNWSTMGTQTAKFNQSWPNLVKVWSIDPHLANIGQCWSKFGLARPKIGPIRSVLVESEPNSAPGVTSRQLMGPAQKQQCDYGIRLNEPPELRWCATIASRSGVSLRIGFGNIWGLACYKMLIMGVINRWPKVRSDGHLPGEGRSRLGFGPCFVFSGSEFGCEADV